MTDVAGVYILELAIGTYVGSSKHVRRRILRHLADLRRGNHSNPKLQRAFNKHGIQSTRTLLICREDDLLVFEQRALDILKPRYNLTPTAGRNTGHRHNTETLVRMRESGKRAWLDRSRVVGDDQKQRISASSKGRIFSEETRAKISAAKLGIKRTPEQRAAMSAAKMGRKINQRGHAITSEILAKIAATKAARARIIYEGRDS